MAHFSRKCYSTVKQQLQNQAGYSALLLSEMDTVFMATYAAGNIINGKLGDNPGREHNSHALTMWMAGGDVKEGATAGETDEFGLQSTGEPLHIRHVHATILDLLGLDDNRLRYLHAGRLRQLTDIGGKVIDELIA